MISYNTKLIPSCRDDFFDLEKILEAERFVFNLASQEHFGAKKNSLMILHSKVYGKTRKIRPDIPSQVVIKAEQACLSAYKAVKSNKHKTEKAIEKKSLSIRLDKRLYSCPTKEGLKITTMSGRKQFKFLVYPKLKELLEKYPYRDPLVFKRNGELWIGLTFETDNKELKSENIALGVDLGIRVAAACSDGRLIIDRKYNKEKRKLRFLKRSLQSKKTQSAKRHLKKLRNKERNKSKNQSYLITNEILRTKAGTIALEDLTGIKKKKNKYQNKRAIAQVPFFKLREILAYKARILGKQVICVCPIYTSQTDSVTGKREGERRGRRFYAKSGLIYDADLNASVNIGNKTKLPLSYGNILDGAGRIVNLPNVGVCNSQARD
jgi:IS605 OrfB family transposase